MSSPLNHELSAETTGKQEAMSIVLCDGDVKIECAESQDRMVIHGRNVKTELAEDHEGRNTSFDRHLEERAVAESQGASFSVSDTDVKSEPQNTGFVSVIELKREAAEDQGPDFLISQVKVEKEEIQETLFPAWPELMVPRHEGDTVHHQHPLSTSRHHVAVGPLSCDSQLQADVLRQVRFQWRRHRDVRIHVQEEMKPFQTKNTQQLKCDLSIMERNKCIKSLGDRPIRIQQDSLSCHNSEAAFSTVGSISRHHSSQKVAKHYKCKVCSASFKRPSQLGFHQYVHTGEKPYKCDKCDVRFTQPSSLRQHQNIHTGVKPHKCSICGIYFRTSSNLRQHKNIHTGETPYKCDACGLGFRSQSNLSRHHRIHPREKTQSR